MMEIAKLPTLVLTQPLCMEFVGQQQSYVQKTKTQCKFPGISYYMYLLGLCKFRMRECWGVATNVICHTIWIGPHRQFPGSGPCINRL